MCSSDLYAFNNHDNLLAVISSFAPTKDIVATKFENKNGIEIAAITASTGYTETSAGPLVLVTKFSKDNKTLTVSYYSHATGYISSTEKTVNLSKIGELGDPITIEGLPAIAPQQNGANKAYIFGYEGNTFRPNANMTRAEACTIFARLLLGVTNIPDGYTTRFEDVKIGRAHV